MVHIQKVLCLILFGLLISSLGTGCSSDSTSSNDLSAGDTTSQSYQSAKSTVDSQMDFILSGILSGMGNLDGFNPPPTINSPTDTSYYGYDRSTGWWYFYTEEESLSYDITRSDSVRFSTDGSHQQIPDSTTDKMEYKQHLGMVTSSLMDIEATSYSNWVFTDIDTDTIEINGNGNYVFVFTSEGDEYTLTMTQDFDAVKAGVEGEFPFTGTVSCSMSGYFYSDQGSQQMTFTIVITFYENHYRAYISDGTYYWEWDEYYDGVG